MIVKDKNKDVWREIAIECMKVLKVQSTAVLLFVKENKENRMNLALLQLTKRILINIRAILDLAGISYKNEGALLFKLPVGLLLRNSLMDCLTGLHILKQDDMSLNHLLEKLNHDYVSALFEEFEVYRDKICFSDFSNEFAEQIYTMSLEDTFSHYFDINVDFKDSGSFKERSRWKVEPQSKYIPESIKVDTKLSKIHELLSKDSQLSNCSNSIYAYYKYFSQWEHFSESGTGDAFAGFGEDNIKIPMAFSYINTALDFMLNNTNKG